MFINHHNPSCDKCAHGAEVKKDNAKRELGRQNVIKERLSVI